MDVHTAFGLLAALFSLSAFLPYIYETVRGSVTPNRATWFIWTFVPGMVFVSGVIVEAEASNWLTGAYTLGSFLVFLASLKNGEGGTSRFDLMCLGMALVGIAGWATLKNPLFAYFAFVAADLSGGGPVILKSFSNPESESKLGWTLFLVGGLCSIGAITGWEAVQDWFYPVLVTSFQALVCFFLYSRIGEKKEV